jgi:hypothetical protein
LFNALPANTHLRMLDCSDNALSDAFTREQLLPAVRANTSLRQLSCSPQLWTTTSASAAHALAEAEALVARRAAGR